MISLKGLTVKFGSHAVLNNLHADFEEGMIHGIVGLNGAGKTTFFNSLSCIQKLDAGTMVFQSQPITHHKIGYLESNNFFYSRITGNEYLKLFSATNKQFD
jgi:ABC-2 type transport system ATP-binding protein